MHVTVVVSFGGCGARNDTWRRNQDWLSDVLYGFGIWRERNMTNLSIQYLRMNGNHIIIDECGYVIQSSSVSNAQFGLEPGQREITCK